MGTNPFTEWNESSRSDRAIKMLAEQLAGLIAIIDTPMGRRKLGIDPNQSVEDANIPTLTLIEAKGALKELEDEGMLSNETIKNYSHFWK